MKTDMSPQAVTERLRWVSEARRRSYYSSAAVTARLRRVEELRRLCLMLGRAGSSSRPDSEPSA